MGLGLSHYIPFLIYYISFVVMIISLFRPLIGIFFLFTLLPYQAVFEVIKELPAAKDMNDIIIVCISIGTFLSLHNRKHDFQRRFNLGNLNLSITILAFVSFIGLINSTLSFGLNVSTENPFLVDWKNYMLLPIIYFLTFKNIRKKDELKYFLILLIIGILGVDYYFNSNLKWMNIWHYSEKARNLMTGLFVYLGANHYGAFFAHFFFILLGLFFFIKKKILKLVLLLIAFLTLRCAVFTFSRGAYLAIIGGLFFLGITKKRLILLSLLLFFIFWRSLVPISVVERIDMTRNEEGQLEESAAKRVELWNCALNMFRESPVIGKGYNTFQVFTNWDTHNMYLKIMAELGILGLLSFLYFLYQACMAGWKLFKETKDNLLKGLGLGFSACVISVIITNAFGDRWSYLSLGSYFWIFLGLVMSARVINRNEIELDK